MMPKLTTAQAQTIRQSPKGTKTLAERYNVHRTTIQRIRAGKHWNGVPRGRPAEDVAVRFWRHVDKTGTCWVWIGAKNRGYGVATAEHKRTAIAHRLSWQLANGPIPPGMFVLHRCDNPPCVRPDHLWLGTQADNIADCVAKGRQAKGKRHGAYTHPERFGRRL